MWRALIGAAIFSGFINLLGLVGPLFMMEVYDRVLPSQSVPTLVSLIILVFGLYAFAGFLEIIRGRTLGRFAALIDKNISKSVITVISGVSLRTKVSGDVLKPVQEADQIRSFLGGSGLSTVFDLPWIPVYLAVCFFLHPLIGWLAAGTMFALVSLTILAGYLTRRLTRQSSEALTERNRFGEAVNSNAEAIAAMGLLPEISEQWEKVHTRTSTLQLKSNDVYGLFAGVSKGLRHMVQSGALALGAWLVLQGNMSGGSIIAASIIVARTLQPIELVISNWRNMVAAHQAWHRLQNLFKLFPPTHIRTTLPHPTKSLHVAGLFAAPPNTQQRMTVQNVSLQADAGTAIGIIGPSASGKSSLVRSMTGVWPVLRGQVCLDGASLDQWSAQNRGQFIGYMPQHPNLLPGTIARNIARFEQTPCDEKVIAAAQAARVHEMIVALPDGYETQVGTGGLSLSAGQRQRIALARALYGQPFLVVLDEPNSNLDLEGEHALAQAIAGVKARGGIAIIVAHRSSVLSQVDMLLLMEGGAVKAFGPRDTILKSLQDQQKKKQGRLPKASQALKLAEGQGSQR